MSLGQWVAGQGPGPGPRSGLSCLRWGVEWALRPLCPASSAYSSGQSPHLSLPISFLNSPAGNTASSRTDQPRAFGQLNRERLWSSACHPGGALQRCSDRVPCTPLPAPQPTPLPDVAPSPGKGWAGLLWAWAGGGGQPGSSLLAATSGSEVRPASPDPAYGPGPWSTCPTAPGSSLLPARSPGSLSSALRPSSRGERAAWEVGGDRPHGRWRRAQLCLYAAPGQGCRGGPSPILERPRSNLKIVPNATS